MKRPSEKTKSVINYALLASVAIIWGFGFVFMKQVMAYISPALLSMLRFAVSAVVMLVIFFKPILKLTKKQWLSGIIAGLFMALGFGLQTYGLAYTSSSNAALLTGLNIVMVPFFAWIFYKKRPPIKSFIAGVCAFGGIAFLSFGGLSKLNIGDLLCFLCAVAFAIHFIILSKITKDADTNALTFVQMLTSAIVFTFIGLVFDFPSIKASTFNTQIIFPLFSLCVLSTGYAYVVQTRAQKTVPPSRVSLILSCESILGAIFSVLLGLESFTWYLGVAVAIVALALFISESNLHFGKKSKTLPQVDAPTADIPVATTSAEDISTAVVDTADNQNTDADNK